MATQVLTSILLRKSGQSDLTAVGFGNGSARQAYDRMSDADKNNHLLFERFKMCLLDADNHGEGILMATATNGERRPAILVCWG